MDLKLEHQLMNAFRRTTALSRRRRREKLAKTEETGHIRGMGHILDSLSTEDGKSQKCLAESVGIRPQSLSEALRLLEERGEIRREASPEDRRITLVFLTEKGKEKREKLSEIRLRHAEGFFGVLSEKEQQQLLFLLEKINAQAEKEEPLCPHP